MLWESFYRPDGLHTVIILTSLVSVWSLPRLACCERVYICTLNSTIIPLVRRLSRLSLLYIRYLAGDFRQFKKLSSEASKLISLRDYLHSNFASDTKVPYSQICMPLTFSYTAIHLSEQPTAHCVIRRWPLQCRD